MPRSRPAGLDGGEGVDLVLGLQRAFPILSFQSGAHARVAAGRYRRAYTFALTMTYLAICRHRSFSIFCGR